MIIWVDDLRPAPDGAYWARSTNDAIAEIMECMLADDPIDYIDLDHDAGDFAWDGGDFINVLNWIEEKGIPCPPIHFHTMNPVGRQNMRRICDHNGWRVI